ncbi:MAG: helix-turn-helix domain-containing protein [Bifidobacteriaceae bacterium]|jgi:transcriptional regulator with XRE-family HTH domain|nr:helix-turn-helix domain-containing protein [Bifidobacteriaceae bacterium]
MVGKVAFGQFIATKRRDAGLSQRDVAGHLHVTESAVSKWERGVSYPDITLVTPLARLLQVSETELVTASDDHSQRAANRDARTYRRWRTAVLWIGLGSYSVALLTCFIVNLAVQGRLTWFFIVLPALAIPFSLTTLPLLVRGHRGAVTLGAFGVSLFALLTVCWLWAGGRWLPVTLTALVFGGAVIFGPVILKRVGLAQPLGNHRAALALTLDTALLPVLVAVAMATGGTTDQYWRLAAPAMGAGIAMAWIVLAVIRYLPVPGLYRAAAVSGLAGVFTFLLPPYFDALVGSRDWRASRPIDLRVWDQDHINGNIDLTIALSCLVIALILLAGGVAMTVASRRRSLPDD